MPPPALRRYPVSVWRPVAPKSATALPPVLQSLPLVLFWSPFLTLPYTPGVVGGLFTFGLCRKPFRRRRRDRPPQQDGRGSPAPRPAARPRCFQSCAVRRRRGVRPRDLPAGRRTIRAGAAIIRSPGRRLAPWRGAGRIRWPDAHAPPLQDNGPQIQIGRAASRSPGSRPPARAAPPVRRARPAGCDANAPAFMTAGIRARRPCPHRRVYCPGPRAKSGPLPRDDRAVPCPPLAGPLPRDDRAVPCPPLAGPDRALNPARSQRQAAF